MAPRRLESTDCTVTVRGVLTDLPMLDELLDPHREGLGMAWATEALDLSSPRGLEHRPRRRDPASGTAGHR